MHDAFFDGRRRRGRDRHASARSPSCSPSTASPTRPTSINVAGRPHRQGGRRRASPPTAGPASWSARSGPAPSSRRSARSRFAELRDAYEEQVAGPARRRRRRAPHRDRACDLLQAKAAIIGCRRAMAAAGRDGPAHGAGHGRDHRPHARRLRDRRRAHRARGDAARRDRHELRDRPGRDDRAPALPRAARAHVPSSCLPNAGLPSVVDGHTHYDLTPDELADCHTSASSPSSASTSSAAAAAPRPSTCAAVVERVGDLAPAPRARRTFEPSVLVDLLARCRSTRTLRSSSSASAPTPTARKKFRDAMLDGDWDTCVQMATRAGQGRRARARRVRRLRRPRRHRRHGRDRQPLRHPGQRCRSCSTPPSRRCSRPACSTSAARRSSTRPTSRTASARQPPRPRVLARPRVRRRGHLPRHRRGGPGPRRRVEAARSPSASTTSPSSATASRHRPDLRHAHVPAVDRRRRPAPRRACETIEAIRRIKAELPGASHDARPVERELRPHARRPPRAQQRVPARVRARPGSTPPSCTRRASCRCTRSPTSSARSASTSIYDRRRRRLRPAHRADGAVRRRRRPATVEQEDRSGWPVEERLKHRIIDGDRDGLDADLDEALAGGCPALDDRQRRAARRHEGRRRAVRIGRDAAAVRAAVGRDDEGRGRLPRAAHGEGRRRRQGPARARPR